MKKEINEVIHDLKSPLGAIQASAENLSLYFQPELFDEYAFCVLSLEPLHKLLFTELLDYLKVSEPILSHKDRWAFREDLELMLQREGVLDYEEKAGFLMDMGFSGSVLPYMPLLKNESSHQILNLLYKISGVHRSLGHIQQSVQKAIDTVSLARSEGFESKVAECSFINIEDGLRRAISTFSHRFNSEILLSIDFEPLPLIFGYEKLLEDVWMNLLANSLDALNEKGTLSIHSRGKDGFIEVIFQDDGTGFSPEQESSLFHPYFTTKKEKDGTGLGLPICKKIIEKHHGTITLTREKDFTVARVLIPMNLQELLLLQD